MGFLFVAQVAVQYYVAYSPIIIEGEFIDASQIMLCVKSGRFVKEYTNFLVLFYRGIWNLMGKADYWSCMCLVNIICADIAIILAYLIAKKVFGNKTAKWTFAIMIVIFAFSEVTLFYPYTDVVSMPFITGAVYWIMRLCNEKSARRKSIYTIILALTLGFGFLVKPHIVAVMGTAILVFCVIPLVRKSPPPIQKQKNLRHAITMCIAIGYIFFGIVGGFNTYIYNKVDKKEMIPMFWYMYAQSLSGKFEFDGKAYEVALNAVDKDKALLEYIQERLKSLGAKGYIEMFGNKVFHLIFCNNYVVFRKLGDNYYHKSNFFYRIYHYTDDALFLQSLFAVLVFGILLNMFIKKRSAMQIFVTIYPVVILLLVCFVETTSRYFIGALPIFCIGSAAGYSND
jgi:4-amino-4-deoxy-L-arabinose transferase-like glycosyltransferase